MLLNDTHIKPTTFMTEQKTIVYFCSLSNLILVVSLKNDLHHILKEERKDWQQKFIYTIAGDEIDSIAASFLLDTFDVINDLIELLKLQLSKIDK